MNSSTLDFQPWFIPLDILAMVCITLVIILAVLSLLIIILDKTCHTKSIILIANSFLIAFIAGCCILNLHIFTFQNDFKQIYYQDSLCIFRGYTTYVSCALFNYSFLLQAISRYMNVVYPNLLFWQSIKCYISLICLTWIFSFVFPFAFIFTGEVIYNSDNQICQLPFQLSFSIIYLVHCAYMIPVLMIMFIYFKLVRYVKEMSKNVTSANTLVRARRELKMVQQIVIIVMILVILCFPYALFIVISFFTTPPKYHFRIAYIFADVAIVCVMIALFYFTKPLKASLMKRIKQRPNVVIIPLV
ncbi:unnamed protein product [Adineta steineri]|uniref:G-protein coupled receptors family 1 profile domain-containing protein n=1 Tax=Adineta steineri TaxID=433720 RepID=A0A819QRM4_9BILA|nr:unnamed protein product [Adineta steineri]